MRGMMVRADSPHPDPLPVGEGTASLAQWNGDGSGLSSRQRRLYPLPKGEGRGEEKSGPRCADRVATSQNSGATPKDRYGFELFILSGLRLGRRSLTNFKARDTDFTDLHEGIWAPPKQVGTARRAVRAPSEGRNVLMPPHVQRDWVRPLERGRGHRSAMSLPWANR